MAPAAGRFRRKDQPHHEQKTTPAAGKFPRALSATTPTA
jgi:hypothetical protein